jgi:hypothetical protein
LSVVGVLLSADPDALKVPINDSSFILQAALNVSLLLLQVTFAAHVGLSQMKLNISVEKRLPGVTVIGDGLGLPGIVQRLWRHGIGVPDI